MSREESTLSNLSLGEIVKTLGKSVRENKKDSIRAPLYVTGEVIIECTIPFITSNLINEMQAGTEMRTIAVYGAILTVLALL